MKDVKEVDLSWFAVIVHEHKVAMGACCSSGRGVSKTG